MTDASNQREVSPPPEGFMFGSSLRYDFGGEGARVSVVCSAGEYTVELQERTNYGYITIAGRGGYFANVRYIVGGVTHYDGDLAYIQAIPFVQNLPSYVVSGAPEEVALFEFYYRWDDLSEADVLALPDTISYSENYTFVIDKIN